MFCVRFANQRTLTSLIVPIEKFRPYSEVGAHLVPPNGVPRPRTKTVPSSCGANMPNG